MLQKAHENKVVNKKEVDIMKIKDKDQIVQNRSSVHISGITSDDYECRDCDYCKPKNEAKVEGQPKSDEIYYMGGLSSGKFRIDHFESALDLGACRSGDFIYFRN